MLLEKYLFFGSRIYRLDYILLMRQTICVASHLVIVIGSPFSRICYIKRETKENKMKETKELTFKRPGRWMNRVDFFCLLVRQAITDLWGFLNIDESITSYFNWQPKTMTRWPSFLWTHRLSSWCHKTVAINEFWIETFYCRSVTGDKVVVLSV